MICPYCKKEYSEKVCRIHIPKCAKNPKNMPPVIKKTVAKKPVVKKGKK